MAMQVNGYYAPMGMGAAAPSPVIVPVNNANANSTDAYIQSVAVAAPAGAGAMPGRAAVGRVREAKGFYLAAKGSPTTSRGMTRKAVAASNGRGALMGTMWSAIKSSLIFNGLLSLAINGYKVANKTETMGTAGGEFAGDMTSAVVGGAAAGICSGLGTFALAGLMGTGLPLTLAGMAIGAVGYFLADRLLRGTSFFNQIKQSVHNMIGA